MNPFTIIENACVVAVRLGVPVNGDRASFDWTGCGDGGSALPRACNAFGAVLLTFGQARIPSRWGALQKILGVDASWLYRFSIGWSNRLGLMVVDHDFKIVGKDDVSHTAKAMAKRLTS